MRYLLVISFFLTSAASVLAQRFTLSGKIVDAGTGEPLGYASIFIKGKPIGTVSNLQGEFDFHIPNEYRNETLNISMLGYLDFQAPVWTLMQTAVHEFRLERSVTLLKEIVVTDSLMGGDILRAAVARIDQNFPATPFELNAFYRDVKKVGGSYISLLEAAVKIYDDNYEEPRNKFKLRERVRLEEVRQSMGYQSKFTSYFDRGNLLEELLLGNYIRYRQIDMSTDFLNSLRREKDSYYNGHEVFVVSHSAGYSLKFFIDKSDFAFLRLEYETVPGHPVDKRQGLVGRLEGLKETIDFKRFEGKMYLNYISMTTRVNWYDLRTDAFKFETELFQQLMINKMDTNPDERITGTERMRSYGLQFQNKPYNKEFWENYNVIKESPLDKKILADLERVGPLEEQFEEN